MSSRVDLRQIWPKRNPDGTLTVRVESVVGQRPDFTEWWTKEDHEDFNKYVEQTKADGTFGTKQIFFITVKPNPLLDQSVVMTQAPLSPTSLKVLDIND